MISLTENREDSSSKVEIEISSSRYNTPKPNRRFNDDVGESFAPINNRRNDFLREIDHLELIVRPPRALAVKATKQRGDNPWCTFHHMKDHHTEDCIQFKRVIEALILCDKLYAYIKEDESVSTRMRSPKCKDSDTNKTKPKKGKSSKGFKETRKSRHTLNTIVRICKRRRN